MEHRRWIAIGLAFALLVAPGAPAGAGPPGARDVIANLFEWNWASVAAECRGHLGPRGYGYVQVSPPQEHIRGRQWWVAYQPVSYRIESRKGAAPSSARWSTPAGRLASR